MEFFFVLIISYLINPIRQVKNKDIDEKFEERVSFIVKCFHEFEFASKERIGPFGY